MRTTTLSALALATLCACAQLPTTGAVPKTDSAAAEGAQPGAAWTGSKLYARDGSVVSSPEPAPGAADGANGPTAAPRDLAPSEGGRMYILELYQKAIDERDALELEVRSLEGDRERVRQSLAASEQENAAQRAKLDQLAAENQRLVQENLELAARLTTAQIRRLQAEKILLEARIEELKTSPAPESAPKGS
jgi:hypothetical protein